MNERGAESPMIRNLELIQRVVFSSPQQLAQMTPAEIHAFIRACRQYWPEGITDVSLGDHGLGVRAELQS